MWGKVAQNTKKYKKMKNLESGEQRKHNKQIPK